MPARGSRKRGTAGRRRRPTVRYGGHAFPFHYRDGEFRISVGDRLRTGSARDMADARDQIRRIIRWELDNGVPD